MHSLDPILGEALEGEVGPLWCLIWQKQGACLSEGVLVLRGNSRKEER